MRPTRRILTLIAVLAVVPVAGTARAADPVVVFAAASLKNALDDAAAGWTKETGTITRISYA
ncbi:molybdate ABC transporter substrate-binding protein, partial [Methylobacterium sp. WL2]